MKKVVLALEDVSKTFAGADHVQALRGVNLEIFEGTRVAVMGPSGSGKSTLLNIACGLDVPTSGKVILDGQDLGSLTDDARTRLRRQKIGMIFQTFNLLPTLTATENVSLPLRLNGTRTRIAEARAAEMLRRVGLSASASRRPDEMSGGERQRVAIARSLVFDPSLVLADEPTGNLDSINGDAILALLDELHDEYGTTIVLVTHNEEAAAHCGRRITLLDGRIVRDTAVRSQETAAQ